MNTEVKHNELIITVQDNYMNMILPFLPEFIRCTDELVVTKQTYFIPQATTVDTAPCASFWQSCLYPYLLTYTFRIQRQF